MSIDFPMVTERCQLMIEPDGPATKFCVGPPRAAGPTPICLLDEHGNVVTIRDFSGIAVRLCVPRNLLK